MKHTRPFPDPHPIEQTKSFHAQSSWKPTAAQLRRGRVLVLKELSKPHNLTVAQFARLAGKTRSQVYQGIRSRKLLTLSGVGRDQRIPDWQLDRVKKKFTEAMLEEARDVDAWTLYYTLSDQNDAFAGKAPINVVTPGKVEQLVSVLLCQLGIHR